MNPKIQVNKMESVSMFTVLRGRVQIMLKLRSVFTLSNISEQLILTVILRGNPCILLKKTWNAHLYHQYNATWKKMYVTPCQTPCCPSQ